MRKFLLIAAMLGVAHGAHAADMPDFGALRGAMVDGLNVVPRSWEGTYVGGQFGYTSADFDFTRAASSLTDSMLKNDVLQSSVGQFDLLQKTHNSGTGFGGFVGRNWQWDDAVLGVEANYNHFTNLKSSSANSMALIVTNPTGLVKPDSDTYYYYTSLDGKAALAIQDAVTLRLRAGWAAGDWMPYMFGGAAIGHVDASRSATLNVTTRVDRATTVVNPITGTSTTSTSTVSVTSRPEQSLSEDRASSFVGGYTFGLGTEVALFGNLFARAEWEYIKFLKVKDMSSSINTVRGGIGYRF
jgi:outer membrane immunogenic protein